MSNFENVKLDLKVYLNKNGFFARRMVLLYLHIQHQIMDYGKHFCVPLH